MLVSQADTSISRIAVAAVACCRRQAGSVWRAAHRAAAKHGGDGGTPAGRSACAVGGVAELQERGKLHAALAISRLHHPGVGLAHDHLHLAVALGRDQRSCFDVQQAHHDHGFIAAEAVVMVVVDCEQIEVLWLALAVPIPELAWN
jgi:hypothetical protein